MQYAGRGGHAPECGVICELCTELSGTGTSFGLSRMGFASLGTVLLTAFVALYMYKKKQRYYDLEGSSDDNV